MIEPAFCKRGKIISRIRENMRDEWEEFIGEFDFTKSKRYMRCLNLNNLETENFEMDFNSDFRNPEDYLVIFEVRGSTDFYSLESLLTEEEQNNSEDWWETFSNLEGREQKERMMDANWEWFLESEEEFLRKFDEEADNKFFIKEV